MRKVSGFITSGALALLLLVPAAAPAEDPGALHRAKRLYAEGLAEFEAWFRSLDRARLAEGIARFKDSFTADPNFSKSYYAIVSALEELEAGSSETVAESLRELVENLFDPFVTGGAAAQEVAALETLGVCMERIRTLEAATAHARPAGRDLATVLPFRPACPSGGGYRATERDGTVEIACSLHGRPTGPAGYAADFAAAAKRFASPAYRLHREGLALLRQAAFAKDAAKAKAARRKAAQLFLKASRDDASLVEARIGYLQVAADGKLKPGELDAFAAGYRKLLGDPALRRYGRLAAGELLDLEIDVRCTLGRLLVAEGVGMYLLNIPAARKEAVDLGELVAKGYLKRPPACPKGGAISAAVVNGKPAVRCSLHGE